MTVLSNAVAQAQTSKVASQGSSHPFPILLTHIYLKAFGWAVCNSGSETPEVVCLADKRWATVVQADKLIIIMGSDWRLLMNCHFMIDIHKCLFRHERLLGNWIGSDYHDRWSFRFWPLMPRDISELNLHWINIIVMFCLLWFIYFQYLLQPDQGHCW